MPTTKSILFDLTPHQVARICGKELPAGYKKKLMAFEYGPVLKIDIAVSEPIPWLNEETKKAGTFISVEL